MKLLRAVFLCLAIATVTKAERPNIIFIFADDWGWEDLSCHDHPFVKTPNIDRLAKEGRDFHRFTVASPVCSPSRTAVMTGHFPARHLVDGHFATVESNTKRGMPDWVKPSAPSLPRMLQQAGYATAHFGKWHLSNNMIPDSPSVGEYGYDTYGAFNCSGEQMPYDHDVDRSIAFIEHVTSQEQQKPFFINLWIHEPHTPFHVIPKYRQMFPEITDEGENIYAATLAYADERIGELLDYLDEAKLTDNTLVIFSSDNGPARAYNKAPAEIALTYDSATGAGFGIGAAKGTTAGRKGWKASLHEGGMNVPFLVRWPGKIEPGTVDNQSLISAVDLLPTFLNIAGGKLPADYQPDGLDYTDVLKGELLTNREKALFSRYSRGGPAMHWASYMVTKDGFKYLATDNFDRVEIYNLATDPLENVNLSNDRPELVTELRAELDAWLATLPSKPQGEVFSKLRNTSN